MRIILQKKIGEKQLSYFVSYNRTKTAKMCNKIAKSVLPQSLLKKVKRVFNLSSQ